MNYTDNRKAAHNMGFAIAGLTCFVDTFMVGESFVLRMNCCAKTPRHRKPPKRCAKVGAERKLLLIEARITSAAVSKRFRCRKNLQHICGLAKFPQESKLSEETSPIRASLAETVNQYCVESNI